MSGGRCSSLTVTEARGRVIALASPFRVEAGLIRRGANIDFHSRFHLSVPLRHPGAVPHLFSISFVSLLHPPRRHRALHLQTNDNDVRGAERFSASFHAGGRRRRSGAGGRWVGRGEEEVRERKTGRQGERRSRKQRQGGGRDGGVIIYQVFGCA